MLHADTCPFKEQTSDWLVQDTVRGLVVDTEMAVLDHVEATESREREPSS
jgi:hypothetical protein